MTQDEINLRVNRRKSLVRQLDTIVTIMEHDGDCEHLIDHVESITGDLLFQQQELMESYGQAIVEKK